MSVTKASTATAADQQQLRKLRVDLWLKIVLAVLIGWLFRLFYVPALIAARHIS